MSLLAFYWDESGTDRKCRVAAVAGYLGQVSEWRRFEREWGKVLKKYRVHLMHRSHLETWHGEFTADCGWNPTRRAAFLRELHPIIKSCTKVAVGTAIIKEDWQEVMPDWLKRFFGGVYGWCAHECVVAVRVWCERPNRGHAHPITWAFEQGAQGQAQVLQMFTELSRDPTLKKEYRLGPISFPGKEVVPLQAADTLAYEIFKQVENQILDRGEKPRRAIFRKRPDASTRPNLSKILGQSAVERMARTKPTKRRARSNQEGVGLIAFASALSNLSKSK
jgi:hypothetical protein